MKSNDDEQLHYRKHEKQDRMRLAERLNKEVEDHPTGNDLYGLIDVNMSVKTPQATIYLWQYKKHLL